MKPLSLATRRCVNRAAALSGGIFLSWSGLDKSWCIAFGGLSNKKLLSLSDSISNEEWEDIARDFEQLSQDADENFVTYKSVFTVRWRTAVWLFLCELDYVRKIQKKPDVWPYIQNLYTGKKDA
jgi:hypothetical protein